jgi:DNA-binding NtrC family response regulator
MTTSLPPAILIVDDDASLVAGITRVLRREPYRILSCTSGDAALEIIGTQSVDVLVTDEQMPGMSGTDLVMAVRRLHPAIVSIMLSGEASMGAVIRALNQGEIFRFLIKPCSHKDMSANIIQALRYKLMLDHCRELLPIFRHQTKVLTVIEARQPGLIHAIEQEFTTRALVKRTKPTVGDDLADRLETALTQRVVRRA